MCCLVYISLTQVRVILGNGTSIKKINSQLIDMLARLWGVLLIDDWYRRVHLTLRNVNSGHIVNSGLWCYMKATQASHESQTTKQHFSMTCVSVPYFTFCFFVCLFEFLLWTLSMICYDVVM